MVLFRWNTTAKSHRAALVDLLKEFHAVAIVDMYSDQHRPWRIESFMQGWGYFIRMLNLQAGGPESFRIFHGVDGTKLYPRSAVVFDLFLRGDHVVASIDPNHVDDMRMQPHRGLKFIRRKQKATISRNREHFLMRANQRRSNGPGQRHAERLLAIGDQELSRAKAEEIAAEIHADRSHV